MTRQGWAEKLVGYAGKIDWAAKAAFTHVTDESLGLSPNAANARIAQLLRAEHRRAVRVVEKEIKWQAARIAEEQQAHNADGEATHNYALLVAHDILAALQKGRT